MTGLNRSATPIKKRRKRKGEIHNLIINDRGGLRCECGARLIFGSFPVDDNVGDIFLSAHRNGVTSDMFCFESYIVSINCANGHAVTFYL